MGIVFSGKYQKREWVNVQMRKKINKHQGTINTMQKNQLYEMTLSDKEIGYWLYFYKLT